MEVHNIVRERSSKIKISSKNVFSFWFFVLLIDNKTRLACLISEIYKINCNFYIYCILMLKGKKLLLD